MKIVIYLTAPKDFGKTTTIRSVYEKISGNKIEKDGDLPKMGDAPAIINYKNYIIGFCSYGDPDSPQKQELERLRGCDVMICASRTRGTTIKAINDIFPKHKKFGFIPHYQDSKVNAEIVCSIVDGLI